MFVVKRKLRATARSRSPSSLACSNPRVSRVTIAACDSAGSGSGYGR